MSSRYQEIDESGDFLIILRPFTEPFAPFLNFALWELDRLYDTDSGQDRESDEEVDEIPTTMPLGPGVLLQDEI
ncbi:hypothetical protein LMH87_004885 [Akanthomyces muscarius]|uniref:Uncharacterized protein n=1 Tax=Akanthomyces muscarius TaxID=2231603 RepID=A0A9W8UIB1_AKAMU|nr:hypothetical protein LMH87_004885 [Akanthomyces muscarius]KAJ4146055.1 hypothetical protein LMH87_004885 [Akanthomyces muscarius]